MLLTTKISFLLFLGLAYASPTPVADPEPVAKADPEPIADPKAIADPDAIADAAAKADPILPHYDRFSPIHPLAAHGPIEFPISPVLYSPNIPHDSHNIHEDIHGAHSNIHHLHGQNRGIHTNIHHLQAKNHGIHNNIHGIHDLHGNNYGIHNKVHGIHDLHGNNFGIHNKVHGIHNNIHDIHVDKHHEGYAPDIIHAKDHYNSKHSYSPVKDYKSYPKYDFGYGVSDPYSGVDFGHSEKRDGHITEGKYHVLLPDGRLQRVSYYVDEHGYHPTVTYEKIAHYR